MQYTSLGSTSLSVSRLCLGCMSFGTPGGPTHPWAMTEDDAQPFFRRAVEAGINFFDTADHYNHGDSEKITGRALKKYARREEIVIATKVGLQVGTGPNQSGLSRKHIFEAVNQSLQRLQVDHIDILYVHRLDGVTRNDEMLEALEHVVHTGKVLYPAASSMWAWQFAQLREQQKAAGYRPFAAMQNFYNLLYREEEREMMPYCTAEGVGVVPWSPIARGFLAGNRPRRGDATERAKTDPLAQRFFGTDQDYAITEEVARIAGELGVTPAEVAYAWVLSRAFVTAPIAGATRLSQLDQAIAALDLSLTDEHIEQLESLYAPRPVMGHS